MDMKIYDDAELTALQVVREAVTDGYSGAGRTAQVFEAIKPYVEKYRNEDDGDGSAVAGLVVALGRLARTAWSVVLHERLGHYPTQEEMLAELERFELYKIEQHQYEQDNAED